MTDPKLSEVDRAVTNGRGSDPVHIAEGNSKTEGGDGGTSDHTEKPVPDCSEKVSKGDVNVSSDSLGVKEMPICDTAILFCGSTKWNLIGRSSVPIAVQKRGGTDAGEELLAPTRLTFPDLPSERFVAAISGPCAVHIVLLTLDGKAFALGRNDNGQLACSDLKTRPYPVACILPDGEKDSVISAACGRSHTLLVTSSGACYAAGLNTSGQLGIGRVCNSHEPNVTEWTRVALPPSEHVVSVAAGAEFSVWACSNGNVYSAGSGQYGQLGNGRTGEHIAPVLGLIFDTIATPGRVIFPTSDGVIVLQVAAGVNHSLALDSKGKVWSWGFGGYGRLGHRSPKDELCPRQIDTFSAPHLQMDYVSCGATASFACQRRRKTTYFWGITNKSGESVMYPKPLFDLQGHELHCLASGATSTVAATERMVVSWGGSPVHGELGYGKGKQKSSKTPQIMESIEGLYCKSVAEGVAFTVLIVHDETDDDKRILEQLEQQPWSGNIKATKRKAEHDISNKTRTKAGKEKKQRRMRR